MQKRLSMFAGIVAILMLVAAACTPPPPDNEGPFATFVPSVSNGPAPLAVNFDASSSGDPDGTIVQYSWDFGDFNTGAGETIDHTFGAGQYTVRLTVTDDDGATASSTTVISVAGAPVAPTNLQLVGAGSNVATTWGDFSWNQVPGVTQYEIRLNGYFLGGCVTTHSGTIPAPASSGRVSEFGLCLGSNYDIEIRAMANGLWGPWSPTINATL